MLLPAGATPIDVDSFAGAGGASLGIAAALGKPVDLAINHDPRAIAVHRRNHPATRHIENDVWGVDPEIAVAGRPVRVAWFSPDCTHFSKAKGSAPRRGPAATRSRDLAWTAVRWARAVAPALIAVENVEEFRTWGPLRADGRPDPDLAGATFRRWLAALGHAGYRDIDWRLLRGRDYGTPTVRRRMFIVARRDGRPVRWPDPTHGPGLLPYRAAADCMEWHHACPSIFLDPAAARRIGCKRPLVEATLRRIHRGLRKYVLEADDPFIVPADAAPAFPVPEAGEARVAAWLAQHNTGMVGHDLREPLSTLVTRGTNQQLVAACLTRQFGQGTGSSLADPAPTVTAGGGGKTGLVAACLTNFHTSNTGGGQGDPRLPANTILAGGNHQALVAAFLREYHDGPGEPPPNRVLVRGVPYCISDIGMRMLKPRELFRCQGFPDSYVIDADVDGEPLGSTAQTMLCGNTVNPQVAEAVIRANLPIG